MKIFTCLLRITRAKIRGWSNQEALLLVANKRGQTSCFAITCDDIARVMENLSPDLAINL